MPDITERLRDPWEQGAINGRAMFAEAAAEIDALRAAVRSLAGWVRELDPHPSLDPCEYLTDGAEQAAVRRTFAQLPSDINGKASGAFDGWIRLDCGHGWPGSASSRAEAQEFLDLCIATGDAARCPECDEMRDITGPLVDADFGRGSEHG